MVEHFRLGASPVQDSGQSARKLLLASILFLPLLFSLIAIA